MNKNLIEFIIYVTINKLQLHVLKKKKSFRSEFFFSVDLRICLKYEEKKMLCQWFPFIYI